ncbi:hypothetical protein J7J00_04585 [Bacillus sp. ISL-4]|uniref:hypothetical protein n=1 Tax=Bacillus sp. ISL-4 TaxID=2819125 RepID=UPI001BE9532D|nr:hypothetical protein [Bacillus sp. ISL-4]MBT2664763.1 hypothetical protein [Bacillus sp. ISL-4]MBT2671481.1 hypothetical protein [Streptomyces sp. ISL-14]
MLLDVEEIINLTDLSFIKVCNEQYGINRGVYNTIDAWFYKQGISNILERRNSILYFLEFIKQSSGKENNHYKFGHGGLTTKLEEYYFLRLESTVSKIASNL